MESREDLVLKEQRGVSFEQAVMHIEREDLLDVIRHPNEALYPYQKVLVIRMQDYVYPVLCVEKCEERFLKTIILSRQLTLRYLEGDQ